MTTNAECRETLAVFHGWQMVLSSATITYPHWINVESGIVYCNVTDGEPDHPIPDTLDAAANAMKPGYSVKLHINEHGVTIGECVSDDARFERCGDTEKDCRFALALAAWQAGEKAQ